MNILAIGAHPDDIEYGCFGFLKKMKKQGHTVRLLIMCKGERGNDDNTYNRKDEQELAFEKSKFDELIIREYKDGEIPCDRHIITDIETIIKRTNSDLIITHYPDDYHQDHRNVANAAIAAARNAKGVMFYNSYSALHFVPEVYVSIDDELDCKIEILKCFVSQLEKNLQKNIDFIDCSISMNKHYGRYAFSKYAEGLKIHKITM